ncbi:MAG: hypothetical protein ABIH66_01830 [bacterium]
MDRQQPPRPDKIRKMTGGFGWVDHRLRWFMEDMRQEEILLYFFLVIAGNEQGCSWWSTRKITKMLKIGPKSLQNARETLDRRGMISTRKDELSGRIIYQLLPLPIEENERVEIPVKLLKGRVAGPRGGPHGEPHSGWEKGRGAEPAASIKSQRPEEQRKLNQEGLSRLRDLLGVRGE